MVRIKEKSVERKESLIVLIRQTFKLTKPSIFILGLSSFCLFIAAVSQGLGLGIIIPVLNGLTDKNGFLGILSIPVLGKVLKSLPFALADMSIFLTVMVIIAMAVLVENCAMYISRILAAKSAQQMNFTVKNAIYERYLSFGLAFYDKQKMGILNNILSNQSSKSGFLIMSCNTLLKQVGFSLMLFVILVLISWKLTLVVFLLLFANHRITKILANKIKLSAHERVKEDIKLSAFAWGILQNMSLIKIQTTEQKELKRYIATNKKAVQQHFNVEKKQAALPRLLELVNSFGTIILVCVAVFLFVVTKEYSLGRFLVYFVALRRFSQYTIETSSAWAQLRAAEPSIRKVLWVFDETDKVHISSGNIIFQSVNNKIAYKNVYFNYIKNIPVLYDINFEIKKGQLFAIVGPTGAGKTSILQLLTRFYEYNYGSIEIDGINIREFDIKSLRQKIGLVSQNILLIDDTILANITYGIEKVSKKKINEAAQQAYIYNFVMELPDKYDTMVGDRGMKLSGGERQRLSIARAILKNPDILILDEATSALDTETERCIQQAIENLVQNRTVFVIAHRLSTIKNADMILVIEKGRIIEQGPIQKLLEAKGRFYHYWQLQNLFY